MAGASGFVGRRLCAALEDAGHAVRAMTRRPESYEGAGEAVQADVQDTRSLAAAVRGCDAAYYLVHSLDKASFEKTMRPRLAPSGVRRRAPSSGESSISVVWATMTTSCPGTCAAAGRWRSYSQMPASQSRPCARASSSGTADSRGKSLASSSSIYRQ